MRSGVGVDDGPGGVRNERAGGQLVEGIGGRCYFDAMQIDDLANEHGAPKVRGDQLKTPAHAVVAPVRHGASR